MGHKGAWKLHSLRHLKNSTNELGLRLLSLLALSSIRCTLSTSGLAAAVLSMRVPSPEYVSKFAPL